MNFLKWLEDGNIKFFSENKKNEESGILYGVFSSTLREPKTILSKFKRLYDASKNNEYFQKSGQDKFKEKLYNFFIFNGLFLKKDGIWEVTNKGENAYQEIFVRKNPKYIQKFLWKSLNYFVQNSENSEIEMISNLEKSFNNKKINEIKQIINKIDNNRNNWTKKTFKHMTRMTFSRSKMFHEFTKKASEEEFDKLIKICHQNNIFNKYGASKSISLKSINNLLNFLSKNNYKVTQISECSENINPTNRILEIKTNCVIRSKVVVDEVNKRANKICEICDNKSKQFIGKNGEFFNNVHHIIPLGKLNNKEINKYDKKEYMISLCLYHHGEIHNGINWEYILKQCISFLNKIYNLNINFEFAKEKY